MSILAAFGIGILVGIVISAIIIGYAIANAESHL